MVQVRDYVILIMHSQMYFNYLHKNWSDVFASFFNFYSFLRFFFEMIWKKKGANC
jgi:prolipoprotein diacylglyceryltransferase